MLGKHLATLLDKVHDNRQVVVIKRRNDKNVALIAEDELSSLLGLLESVYLLRSPENAKRLFRALDWAQTATEHEDSLEALQAELSGESQATP
jgi:antitoxin YefM